MLLKMFFQAVLYSNSSVSNIFNVTEKVALLKFHAIHFAPKMKNIIRDKRKSTKQRQ